MNQKSSRSLLSQHKLHYEHTEDWSDIIKMVTNLKRRKDYKPLTVMPRVESHIPTFIKWFNKLRKII